MDKDINLLGDEPVQIDARLVPLPRIPLPQHLFHDVLIAGESVDGENVEPAEHQHAESGPRRQLPPVASHQHRSLLVSPPPDQIYRRVHTDTGSGAVKSRLGSKPVCAARPSLPPQKGWSVNEAVR